MFMTKCHANIYVKKPLNEKLFVQRWKDKENILIWTISTRFRELTNCSNSVWYIGASLLLWSQSIVRVDFWLFWTFFFFGGGGGGTTSSLAAIISCHIHIRMTSLRERIQNFQLFWNSIYWKVININTVLIFVTQKPNDNLMLYMVRFRLWSRTDNTSC